ncbi:hypothetical protein O181_080484 [Austropuccinia psidii MF-1]|uniref:Uncharacterized protein n=1 Tax=Austropuccinia psidii MF-1 TaxID=1389203 RepID=A0A9Q3FL01_9BASI|nr:hypothetical protein [Austropuccinia psidii MF-1]
MIRNCSGLEQGNTLADLKNAGYSIHSEHEVTRGFNGYLFNTGDASIQQKAGAIKVRNQRDHGLFVAITTVPTDSASASEIEPWLLGMAQINGHEPGFVPPKTDYATVSSFHKNAKHWLYVLQPNSDERESLPRETD